jgi:hypothetical protein
MVLEAYVHVSIGLSLGFIAVVLAGSIIASLLIPPKEEPPASTIGGAESLSTTRGLDFLSPLSKVPKKNGKPDEKASGDEAAAGGVREQGKSP